MSDALNALVAKKVMGWVAGPRQGGVHVNRSWKNYRLPNSREIVATTESFSPSTDIASAWEVVEKMGETHWQRIKKPSPSRGDSEHWQVMFHKKDALDGGKGINKSVCLAICLAALCAVGVPESEIEAARNQTKGPQ